VLVERSRQTVVISQGPSGVLVAKEPASTENRHHVLDEQFETGRQQWRHDIESVGGPFVNHSSIVLATCSGVPVNVKCPGRRPGVR